MAHHHATRREKNTSDTNHSTLVQAAKCVSGQPTQTPEECAKSSKTSDIIRDFKKESELQVDTDF